ncbi:MAG: response regulator transcription factor [Nitrospiraceae bacterium]|nr:MAG: response regulator transcription factor [Nitrospiraceae bacterium]
MTSILIADDHSIVREGLKQVLVDTPDMVVTDEAKDGNEALCKALGSDFDVVVLDISMPGKNGLEVLREIKSHKPKLPVLILSVYPEDQYALRVLKAGAAGYLSKESAPDELIDALEKVANGTKYISSAVLEEITDTLDINTERPVHERLSDREFQVLRMIASGRTIREIAEELGINIKTVSTYRVRILEKMRIKNNAELTHYAIKNQLVH